MITTHTLHPWTPGPNNTRILASQREWSEVEKWNRNAEKSGVRERVETEGCDLFEPWDGIITDRNGNALIHCTNCREPDGSFFRAGGLPHVTYEHGCGEKMDDITFADIRRDLFRLIDSTPNLIWPLVTRHPQNVWRLWEPTDAKPLPNRPVDLQESPHPQYRENVHLYARITDQSTADALIPELLKLRDLVPVLGVDGVLTGPVDWQLPWIRHADGTIEKTSGIDHIHIRGETGPDARPLHPQWVRDARDQCVAAAVPFAFDGWGEWLPEIEGATWDYSLPERTHLHCWHEENTFSVRVGTAKSGRVLDGREWQEMPAE